MKSENTLIIISIMFFIFAAATSLIIWSDVSIAAKIAFYAFGVGTGVTFGLWMAKRQS
jgi:hypothetical protein